MRHGFTTGSCAAAAAKAAAYMLLTGKRKEHISIMTPKGIIFETDILEIQMGEESVSCGVLKDGGDDPDVTTGAVVYARVEISRLEADKPRVCILGGEGVGVVTKPGLDQPVGEYAINKVPRQMIESEMLDVCRLADFNGELTVTISIPKGVLLAQKTFNPRLGIVGGISVLGTSGVVEPMSKAALIDTIRAELSVAKAEGHRLVAVSPGNYGLEYMLRAYGFDLDKSVKCSNFIGETLDMVAELGFEGMLLTGHIGKLVKIAGGIMNTHSREADCRMELLAAAGLQCDVPTATLKEVLGCVTTSEAVRILSAGGHLENVMAYLMERIMYHLRRRVDNSYRIECIMYENEYGELARSAGAAELLEEIKNGG